MFGVCLLGSACFINILCCDMYFVYSEGCVTLGKMYFYVVVLFLSIVIVVIVISDIRHLFIIIEHINLCNFYYILQYETFLIVSEISIFFFLLCVQTNCKCNDGSKKLTLKEIV